jgi:hypothetical protein
VQNGAPYLQSSRFNVALDLALPIAEYKPSVSLKGSSHFIITLDSSREFGDPVILPLPPQLLSYCRESLFTK